ncbi:helix-turn-helix transcriptional regulator [Bradyrhizobium manausense]|nr:helix-turn-helix transcriptional regulator [Bradyrhizobium manausense]
MADTAGISKQLLSFIIAGDREVTADVYRRFAEALLR